MLDFLRSTGVGRTVPREGGENEEEDDQDGASESSGAEDSMCFLRCFLLCFLRCFLLCFCVYSLADSGERKKPRRTEHFGVRGSGQGCALKLSWASTAEYRMMKLKKKTPPIHIPAVAIRAPRAMSCVVRDIRSPCQAEAPTRRWGRVSVAAAGSENYPADGGVGSAARLAAVAARPLFALPRPFAAVADNCSSDVRSRFLPS